MTDDWIFGAGNDGRKKLLGKLGFLFSFFSFFCFFRTIPFLRFAEIGCVEDGDRVPTFPVSIFFHLHWMAAVRVWLLPLTCTFISFSLELRRRVCVSVMSESD